MYCNVNIRSSIVTENTTDVIYDKIIKQIYIDEQIKEIIIQMFLFFFHFRCSGLLFRSVDFFINCTNKTYL